MTNFTSSLSARNRFRFDQSLRGSSPDAGHLTSRITFARGSTSSVETYPPVSISTSKPSSQRRLINVNADFCASGSPPVTSTRLQPNSWTLLITCSSDTCSPPVNVYSLSHQTQRMGQPVSRTNVHG